MGSQSTCLLHLGYASFSAMKWAWRPEDKHTWEVDYPKVGGVISVVQSEFQDPYFVTEVRDNLLLLSEEDISPIPTPCPKYLVKISGAFNMMLPIHERRVIEIWSS